MVSANLACNSCHDPHGKFRRLSDGSIVTSGAPIISSGSYHNSADPLVGQAVGVYRLLGGIGYTQGGNTFSVNPPAAVTNSTYNRTEASTMTRTAYGSGMSEWCATCHPNMHTNSGRFVHVVSAPMGATIYANYNAYVGSGNMTGTQTSSYLELVPYEENIASDYAALRALAATSATSPIAGPTSASAQVACISCHRAHASGFPEMTRWNNESEFIVYNGVYPGTDNAGSGYARGKLNAEMLAAYYEIPATKFATYQRSLCNKCHAMD
jgi:hypothetical protein